MSEAKYFVPQARLNKGQRKFCHCIMKRRLTSKKSPYSACRYYSKLVPPGENPIQYSFDFNKTNCVINYQYSDYTLEEIQAFCTEKKIPIGYTDATGNVKYYKKNKLVELLTNNYIKRHRTKKSTPVE